MCCNCNCAHVRVCVLSFSGFEGQMLYVVPDNGSGALFVSYGIDELLSLQCTEQLFAAVLYSILYYTGGCT